MKITVDIDDTVLNSNDQDAILDAVNVEVRKHRYMIDSAIATRAKITNAIMACGEKFGSFTSCDVARELDCNYYDYSHYRGCGGSYRVVDVSNTLATLVDNGILAIRHAGFADSSTTVYSFAK